jgi:tRNA A37 threonylcarbamoyladenosine modification protein TsaB
MVDILVISISTPLKIGIYKKSVLVDTYEIDGKTSDILPMQFEKIMKNNDIGRIFYVNSPGSYMAIKVAYVFLKTLCIAKRLPFFAANGFHFNNNSPINALEKKYFINNNGEINMDFIGEDTILDEFVLPSQLDESVFSKETLPIYNLPAV